MLILKIDIWKSSYQRDAISCIKTLNKLSLSICEKSYIMMMKGMQQKQNLNGICALHQDRNFINYEQDLLW